MNDFLKDDDASGGARIPTRQEIPPGDTWDLTVLYPTPEDWLADLARLKREYPRFAEFKGRVGDSAETLLSCLEFDKELSLLVERLNHYASLEISEDSSDAANLKRSPSWTIC